MTHEDEIAYRAEKFAETTPVGLYFFPTPPSLPEGRAADA